MAEGRKLFKTEAKHLMKVRDALNISCRLNGGQIILGETNQEILKKVVAELNATISKLLDIT